MRLAWALLRGSRDPSNNSVATNRSRGRVSGQRGRTFLFDNILEQQVIIEIISNLRTWKRAKRLDLAEAESFSCVFVGPLPLNSVNRVNHDLHC